MSEVSKIADALLITLQSERGQETAALLGKSLAQRQLDLGRHLGCSRVILLGDDMAAYALDLRHNAEKAGIIVQVASGPHALTALLAPRDRLLVLQADLLAETTSIFDDLPAEGGIITLPAASGAEAGFERIDLGRAWAGALVIRGDALSRLLDLPEDSETAPALLRIGLQAGLTETMLDDEYVTNGSWALIDAEKDRALAEENWLARYAGPQRSQSVSKWIAGKLTRKLASSILPKKAALPATLAVTALLAAGSAVAAWFGMAVLAFGMIGLSALSLEAGLSIARLKAAPFGSVGPWHHMRVLIDLMLFACCILLIDGIWFRQVFGPLVLLAALHLPLSDKAPDWIQYLRDRLMLGAVMAALAAVMPIEPMVMAVALLILGVNLMIGLKERG